MKRKLIVSTAIIAGLVGSFALGASASTDIQLFINGKHIDTDLQIVDGSSYVPLRVVSESLGADVKWDGDTRTITITSKDAAGAGTSQTSADVKTFSTSVDLLSGPMKLHISKVTFNPSYQKDAYSTKESAIVLDVAAENTSTDTVRWYPDQGTLVTNTKSQINADVFGSDDVGGEFIGKVVKNGKLVFPVTNGFDGITSLTLQVRGPFDSNLTRVGDDKTTDILLQ